MKRGITILLCALLSCALLAGCGGPKEESAAGTGTDAPASRYTFTFKGTEVAANADMASLTDKLGEPSDYFESESCAYQGLDKVYTYGSVIIRTYPLDGKDYVLSVELRDDTVSTREGVYIGSSRADVVAAYGEPGEETATVLRYTDGDCTLAFLMADGTVTDITYTAKTP